jgi:hypothetical protein
MKHLFLFLVSAIPGILVAQPAVILQHQGSSTPFSTATPFADAYNAAANGDTIYLPGGVFAPPPNINKHIVVIGAGHYPDSTQATGTTTINTTINLDENADKTVFQGIRVLGYFYFLDKRIDSVVIGRCTASAIYLTGTYDTATNCRGVYVYNSVISDINMGHATNIRVFNNIINNLSSSPRNAWIRNNRITNLSAVDYALVENNTINQTYYWSFGSYSNYRNNVLGFALPVDNNNTWQNNYHSVDWNTLFVKSTAWFDYADNYHLNAPGSYIGTDGFQAGIYGGSAPYKEGAVPFNPHIQSKVIPLQTEANGQLPVQVKVAAQNN